MARTQSRHFRPIRIKLEDIDEGLTKPMVAEIIVKLGGMMADAGVVLEPTPYQIVNTGPRALTIIWMKKD